LINQNLARARTILRLDKQVATALLEKSLTRMPGIVDFEINHVGGTIRVDYDPQKVTFDDIQNIVKK